MVNSGAHRKQENLISVDTLTYAAGIKLECGVQAYAQLYLVMSGCLNVVTVQEKWFVPRGCAIWLAAGSNFTLTALSEVLLVSIRIKRKLIKRYPISDVFSENTFAVFTTPLLCNLVSGLTKTVNVLKLKYLAILVIYELNDAERIRTYLQIPKSKNCLVLADMVSKMPCDVRNLSDMTATADFSIREAARLFGGQIGTPFKQWRHQARIMLSIIGLENGLSITDIAGELGFSSVAAFSRSFSMVMAMTASEFIEKLQQSMPYANVPSRAIKAAKAVSF